MLRLTLIAVAAIAGVLAAHADPATVTRAWTNCQGGAGIWTDLRITGCNAVITSGEAKGGDLAKAYYNRGNAQLSKREYRKAIDDYTAVLAIDAADASALHERCW